MNDHVADVLADRIVRTWRLDLQRDIWADVLANLDRAQATAAYELLRDTEESMPSIARFRQVYHSLDLPAPADDDGYDPDAGAAAAAKFRALMATASTFRERAAAYEAAGRAYAQAAGDVYTERRESA